MADVETQVAAAEARLAAKETLLAEFAALESKMKAQEGLEAKVEQLQQQLAGH